jgi:hypothetical protein
MIRNYPRRLQLLKMHLIQQRLARHLDGQGRSPAELVRERRRRRLAAEGRESEMDRPSQALDFSDRTWTIGEIIRRLRFSGRK